MIRIAHPWLIYACLAGMAMIFVPSRAEESWRATPYGIIDGQGLGWVALGADDFVNVNWRRPDTWTWGQDQVHCSCAGPVAIPARSSGIPILNWCWSGATYKRGATGVSRQCRRITRKAPSRAIAAGHRSAGPGPWLYGAIYAADGKGGRLVHHARRCLSRGQGQHATLSPRRTGWQPKFSSEACSLGKPEWNHYYIRAINGEVRLWVNGEEVSGGTQCHPRSGFLGLESQALCGIPTVADSRTPLAPKGSVNG